MEGRRRAFNKLFVIRENGINYTLLFQELMRSNHPPLYYYILHTAIGLSLGKTATLGIGYLINFSLFLIQILLLYSICSLLFSSRIVPLFAAFLSSAGFLSMDVFLLHKGYELQVTLILAVFYLVFSFFKRVPSVDSLLALRDCLPVGFSDALFLIFLYCRDLGNNLVSVHSNQKGFQEACVSGYFHGLSRYDSFYRLSAFY